MNFALLGDDAAVLPLVSAIRHHPDHALTHAALLGTTSSAVRDLLPTLHVCANWEALLTERSLDAVIVAGTDEAVRTGAKQLAAAGASVLLFPRAAQESTFIYELTLIRDDTHVRLFPVFPFAVHPTLKDLQERIDAGLLGGLLYLELRREIRKPTPSNPPAMLSPEEIDEALLPDLVLLRCIGGDYRRVTAHRSGTLQGRLLSATVRLAGENLPEASWSVSTAEQRRFSAPPASQPTTRRPPTPSSASHWQLVVRGETGRAVLSGGDDGASLQLEVETAEEPTRTPWQFAEEGVESGKNSGRNGAGLELDIGRELLETIQFAMAGGPARYPDWSELTRAFEMVDATHQSLRRGRTIDVRFETTSERNLFKTQMTAVGCGVLMFTFVGVLLLLLVGAFFEVGGSVMAVARIAVFLPLVLFLLLQLLVFLARPSTSEPSATNRRDGGEAI